MQIKKRHTLSINHSNASSSRHSSSDFTSILNESPWGRFVDKAMEASPAPPQLPGQGSKAYYSHRG